MYPAQYKYTDEHEWINLEGDLATIGITDYAQHELGEIVFVELPQKGTELAAHDVMGSVESVKAVSDIFAPVSGTVEEANGTLDETPELVNSDPHGAGWIARIRISNKSELDNLMDAAAYEKFLAQKAE